MAAVFLTWFMIIALLFEAILVMGSFPATLKLERSIPLVSHELELSQLRERDRLRHGRLLQSSPGVVVDFPVIGTYDPFLVGLYYTKIQLGSPPREFNVQIDTGSDVLWIGCNSCNGCPQSSGLQIQLDLFDPGSSSTVSLVSCSDQRCSAGLQSSDSGCYIQSNRCSYTFQYGDGSGTSGYYVADLLHFNSILEGSVITTSTANVMFGCSVLQTGDLTKSYRAVDGIFGFGQQSSSVISQLSSQGITPKVFSHCLKGSNGGGGILVFGEILHPDVIYTPLIPSQYVPFYWEEIVTVSSLFYLVVAKLAASCLTILAQQNFKPHYNLDLRSISVGGKVLSINPSVFSTSSNQGTIVDSGTTLAYLAEEAYDAFMTAITNTVSQTVRPILSKGNQCYLITSSVNDIFPQVGLNFAGSASMILNPQDYLVQQNSIGGAAAWCIGFQKIQGQGITILGGSMSVNVSTNVNTARTEFVNAGQMSNDGSLRDQTRSIVALLRPIIMLTVLLLL